MDLDVKNNPTHLVVSRQPVVLTRDNKAAILIVANLVFHERTEHIELNCYLVWEKLQKGLIQTFHFPSKYR